VGLTEFVASREGAKITIESGKANGRALFVFDANNATHFLLSDSSGQLFIIDAKTKGLDIIELTTVDKTSSFVELIIKDVEIDILVNQSNHQDLAQRVVVLGRLLIAADSLGASQVMINKSVSYSKERKQFGRVIGSFQAVKHMCAEMAAELEPCHSMTWHAAHCQDNVPEEARLMACQTKAHISEVGKQVSKTATEAHGGMGFTDELGLHYWFKRIGLNRQLLGSPELIREEAGKLQGFDQ
jgi:alkylation response protein AidB-like acyl-CoA dehydrogenase